MFKILQDCHLPDQSQCHYQGQGQDQDQDQGQEVVQTRDVEEDVLVPGEEVGEDQEVLHLEVDVDLEAALLEEGVVLEVHHQNVVNDHQHQNRPKLISTC